MLHPDTLSVSEQMPNRRHTDPPGLWATLILGSLVIHLSGLWIVNRWLVDQRTVELSTEPIPIELIEDKSESSSKTQATPAKPVQTERSTASTQNTSEQRPDNQTSSIVSSSQPYPATLVKPDITPLRVWLKPVGGNNSGIRRQAATKTQENYPRPLVPQLVPSSPLFKNNSAPQTASTPTPSKAESPTTPASTPDASTQAATRSPLTGSRLPPVPSASDDLASRNSLPPTSGSSSLPDQKASESQGGGMVATLSNMRLADPTRDVPNQQAKPKADEKQLSYLPQLSQKSDQVLVLQVALLIDRTGKPEVISTKVLQGNSSVNSDGLAREILENWKFEPAYMGGEAVDQEYLASLKISPLLN